MSELPVGQEGGERSGPCPRDYLELMRLPNVFTAVADVAMGFLFAQPAPPWRPSSWDWTTLALLAASSCCLYLAGMTLNDVFDVELDRRERPERPLPSGRIPIASAQRLGWRLLWWGVAFGTTACFVMGHLRSGIAVALLAAAIVAYDAWLKRTPLGPAAMGACRTLNVLLGMSAADVSLSTEYWLVAVGIGVYVAGLTWFARREADDRQGVATRLHLAAGAVVMLVGLGLLAAMPDWSERVVRPLARDPWNWRLLIGAIGAFIAWRCFWAVADPSPRAVRRAVAHGILSIVTLDAAVCYAIRGVAWASLILLLLIPALWLRRKIAMT